MTERVHAHLERLLSGKRAEARITSPHADALIGAVAELTMRGGKRLRPATAFAALCAVAGGESREPRDEDRWLNLAAALELLQTYFLIQDDWMDGDEQRRGGPSVHVVFTRQHGATHLGANLAILAADLASGLAWELLAQAAFPDARWREALAAFGQMHTHVIYGQQLDLLQHPDIALVHQLKTGSYTVRGPLQLGALLGDASVEQLAALERFGAPLGLAFQLRDDLLGAYGDLAAVGKPVRIDLRAGKLTALIAEARATFSSADREQFDQAFGNPSASDPVLARAEKLLERSGARARVEARLVELSDEACAALESAPFHAQGVAMLRELAVRLTQRNR